MPTVAESISLSGCLDKTMWTPRRVGYLSRPVLAFSTRTTCPSAYTVMMWLATSTTLMCAGPMWNVTEGCVTPHVPGASCTPCRAGVMVTVVPAGQ